MFLTDGFEHGKYYRQLVTPSGIVIVRPDARKLIDCWAKWTHHDQPLGLIEPYAWYWDQVTLAEAWEAQRFRWKNISTIGCSTIPRSGPRMSVIANNNTTSFFATSINGNFPNVSYIVLISREYSCR